jgi:outer membrane protein TolC
MICNRSFRRRRRGAAELATLAAAALLAAPWSAVPASASPPLTLVAAVERAQARYPTIEAARQATAAAEAGLGEAGAARYPSLRFTTRATQHDEPMLVTPIHAFRPNLLPPFSETLFQSSLDLSYPITDGGARGARIDQARARRDAAGADLQSAAQALTASVVATYLEVLSEHQILAAHEQRLRALLAEEERVRALKAEGRAAEIDVLRIEAALASASAEETRLRTGIDIAERELARLTGADPAETRGPVLAPVALADTAAGDRAALAAQVLANSPELAAARERHAASAAGLAAAKGARWPQLDLGASLMDWRDDGGNHSTEWQAGVRLQQAIFEGGAIRERIAGARAEQDRAAGALRLAELEAEARLDRALGAVGDARAQVSSLERARDRFAEVARIERVRLAAGPGTQSDYLAAEAELLAARASLVEAKHREIAARVELARVTGGLDRAWLAATITSEEMP